MYIKLLPCILILAAACVKKSNPTPQLASGNSFVVPADSVADVFLSKPVPEWAPRMHSYKESSERTWDLIHTRLELNPIWAEQQLKGTASLRLQPFFYPQDSLHLDARGFEVYTVKAFRGAAAIQSGYRYDGKKIHIGFGVKFRKGEEISLQIEYLAKPTELPNGGSDAITDDRGLYFINHDGKKAGVPQQIWTQGETQGARCWFPTLDEPNEKCTQEMQITVEDRFKTLSNGLLIKSVKKEGGLRTDFWEMKQPHSPYLFMMAIGQYEVVADKWGKIPLHYWVEPKYRVVARKIFGRTPAMIDFFSRLLDYPFPWPKYDQVVVRNFVSGAMENTSASVFMEALQCGEKELADRNWDDIIAHELFHQWFGDLVTLESWANLPLNESFANYSEYLWLEHRLGKDEADLAGYKEKQQYLYEALRKNEPLIRFHHDKPDDMFDSHSYAKGGRILHMLRNEIGDDAFFEGLRLYLKRHAYKTVEIHDLRLAMEEVSGRDLNWFFEQWFLKPGHPNLSITRRFENNTLSIRVQQNQDTSYFPVYRINLPLEIVRNGKVSREVVKISRAEEEFRFPGGSNPELILADPDGFILAEIEQYKSQEEWQAQYFYAKGAMQRVQALKGLSDSADENSKSRMVLEKALDDSFWLCREFVLDFLKQQDSAQVARLLPKILAMAQGDEKPAVRKAALQVISPFKLNNKQNLLSALLRDSSMAVSSEAYRQYFAENYPDANEKRKSLESDSSNDYQAILSEYYAGRGDEESYRWFKMKLSEGASSGIYDLIRNFGRYLNREENAGKRPNGFQVLYQTAMEGSRAEQVIGAYQVLAEMNDIPDAKAKRKEIREKHRDDDFAEILEYLE